MILIAKDSLGTPVTVVYYQIYLIWDDHCIYLRPDRFSHKEEQLRKVNPTQTRFENKDGPEQRCQDNGERILSLHSLMHKAKKSQRRHNPSCFRMRVCERVSSTVTKTRTSCTRTCRLGTRCGAERRYPGTFA